MTYQLIHGDCLEEMSRIEDGSVDMILADLPYGTTACSWDIVIPFEPLWAHYKRVIKKRGAVVLFGSEPFSSLLRVSNLGWYKYDWVWNKSMVANFGSVKFQPLRQHENILIFYKYFGVYNPQYRIDVLSPFGKLRGDTITPTGNYGDKFQNGVGYPKTIINIPRPNNLTGGGLHPTQKPIALLEYLIKTYTNGGELVLDNTMGSGSTGEACLRTGRRFIGIEKDAGYFQIAKERLERVAAELRGEFVPKPAKGALSDLPMFSDFEG